MANSMDDKTMTPGEFQAWFRGFAEGIDGKPTQKQWDVIVKRMGQIEVKQAPQTIVREYLPSLWNRVYDTTRWTVTNDSTAPPWSPEEQFAYNTGQQDFQSLTLDDKT